MIRAQEGSICEIDADQLNAHPQLRTITALYAFCREVDDAVDECKDPAIARPLIVAFLAAAVVGTFVMWRFIFVVPAAFSLACAACLVAALVTSHRLAEEVR